MWPAALRARSTAPIDSTSSSNRSAWTRNAFGFPQFRFLLTAREDPPCVDPVRPSNTTSLTADLLAGGRRPRVCRRRKSSIQRRQQRRNRGCLKPALTAYVGTATSPRGRPSPQRRPNPDGGRIGTKTGYFVEPVGRDPESPGPVTHTGSRPGSGTCIQPGHPNRHATELTQNLRITRSYMAVSQRAINYNNNAIYGSIVTLSASNGALLGR